MKIKKTQNKKGFTVIEILVIVAIITILVSVVLASMMNARKKAQDNSAFTSVKTMATSAYMCLMNGAGTRIQFPNIDGGNNICSNPALSDGIWPNISKSGWSYDNFDWCDPFYVNSMHPTPCSPYDEVGGTCGGNASGDFCFILEKDDTFIWCTLQGCHKQ